MREKRATSYDVAKLANVSQSAVSRVFSPNGSASKKTREKVMQAAQELGFAPNPVAKSLSLGRSQFGGLVVTQYTQQNYPVALKSAVDFMAETGDSLLIRIVDSSDAGDEAVINLLEKRADFILSAASLRTESAAACQKAGVPLVMVNRRLKLPKVDHVLSPNAEVMRIIAQKLQASGARQMVFLSGGPNNWVLQERWRGFRKACKELDLPEPIAANGGARYDFAMRTIRELFAERRDIDAIVAGNDAMALGAMDALRYDLGLTVPGDIQVVGHDDTEAARYKSYMLTSVRQDMSAMLLTGFRLAIARRGAASKEGEELIVPNKLTERNTTRWGDRP